MASQLHSRYTAPRRGLAVATLRLAQSRGQNKQGVDPETLIDQLWGLAITAYCCRPNRSAISSLIA
ncbi:hypothetical protein J3A64_004700 [Pseudarthrobacter sp. PvP004]|nr:hypothetical protein [Pseudarthrobacter sp. PvP004]MBP2269160.1 hypothetical protein [Pseudarthrobacter sp. PvP004]